MHDAIRSMLTHYDCRTRDDHVNALREILQYMALLGLWRAKFFEHAAFYGGTALRVLHGLDRYSEDLDFSLIQPDVSFSLGIYGDALQREISSFGFHVAFERREKTQTSAIESAFLKANTYQQLITIEADQALLGGLHPSQKLKIRLEVDTDPPGGFETETAYILQPIPFFVRAYSLPDLFAGKIHAVLCRRWKTRVKGRDWYDLAWYCGRFPEVRLRHLEARMRQSGDYPDNYPLTHDNLLHLLQNAIDSLNVEHVRQEVTPFIRDKRALDVWSRDFFSQIIKRIVSI
ncbi:MAG: nucleotidyl transferase AbiEii/AbiGii toxin family protein [Desulfatirhabdiaceae bacterium]